MALKMTLILDPKIELQNDSIFLPIQTARKRTFWSPRSTASKRTFWWADFESRRCVVSAIKPSYFWYSNYDPTRWLILRLQDAHKSCCLYKWSEKIFDRGRTRLWALQAMLAVIYIIWPLETMQISEANPSKILKIHPKTYIWKGDKDVE